MSHYDIVILGAGPGGYTAAIRAAQLGASVALIEAEHIGGTCLNWGCIPTKALYKTTSLYEQMTHAADYGIDCSGLKADLAAMVARKNRVVDQLRQGTEKLLQKKKVNIIAGRGRLTGPSAVSVATAEGEVELTAGAIIIATGCQSAELPLFPVDGRVVLDIKSVLNLTEVPESLLVIGGGVAGCEFAQVFSALGAKITISEMLPNLIRGLDAEIDKTFVRTLKKRKYKLLTGQVIESVDIAPDGVTGQLGSGQSVSADKVLVAVGALPQTKDLGLEDVGVALTDRGFATVDDHCLTNVPNIYAIGDVTGRLPLAHFASHMGLTAVAHARGNGEAKIDETAVPKTVFTSPELAWVGLTEAEAADRFGQVKIGTFLIRALGRTMADGQLDGLAKIVAAGDDDRVVGVHLIGPNAAELIAEGTLAVRQGVSLADLAETIHAHPTYPEAIGEAAEDALGLAIHKL